MSPRNAAAVLALSILVGAGPAAGANRPSNPVGSQSSIYWGAYIEGLHTYNNLYGGTWSNGPWCDPGTQCPLARFRANAGKTSSIEHWGMCWGCSFPSAIASVVVKRGDIPAIDWATSASATNADIAAGKYDTYVRSIAQAAKNFGHPMVLLFSVEMNGTWYPYSPGQNGNTAASFVAMWRHVHDVFVSIGATNVTWAWVPNVDPYSIYPSLSSLYPGDAYVDWTGLIGYNWGAGARIRWMSFSQVFSSSYKTLLQIAPQKPIMIGEIASEEHGGNKAAWITDMLTTQLPKHFTQIKALLWFNYRIYEKSQNWNWPIESSASSQAAFAQGIASPYYAPGGSFTSLPMLKKVQPLPQSNGPLIPPFRAVLSHHATNVAHRTVARIAHEPRQPRPTTNAMAAEYRGRGTHGLGGMRPI